jgi:hypothetical protein
MLTHGIVVLEGDRVIAWLNVLSDVLSVDTLIPGKVAENDLAIRRLLVCLRIEISLHGSLSWLQMRIGLVSKGIKKMNRLPIRLETLVANN